MSIDADLNALKGEPCRGYAATYPTSVPSTVASLGAPLRPCSDQSMTSRAGPVRQRLPIV
jgi:hypothetical protein